MIFQRIVKNFFKISSNKNPENFPNISVFFLKHILQSFWKMFNDFSKTYFTNLLENISRNGICLKQ